MSDKIVAKQTFWQKMQARIKDANGDCLSNEDIAIILFAKVHSLAEELICECVDEYGHQNFKTLADGTKIPVFQCLRCKILDLLKGGVK